MADKRSVHSMDEIITSEIRDKYKYLYDYRDHRHRDRNLREKAWREIGVSIGVEAKIVSARWKTLRDKYVREKKKPRSGSGAEERQSNSLHSLLGYLDDSLSARKTSSSLSQCFVSSAPNVDVEEEAACYAEDSISISSIITSPLPSTYCPSCLTPPPLPSPKLPCSNTIISSLPFTASTSASSEMTPEPTTPIVTPSEPVTPARNGNKTARKANDSKKKEEDVLAALLRSQPKEMDEIDLYCSSLAARLRQMPSQDMARIRFSIEKLLFDYSQKRIKGYKLNNFFIP